MVLRRARQPALRRDHPTSRVRPHAARAADDALGVTAEFNRIALRVLNRELGGDFDPDLFDHRAVWIADQRRIEMRLRSRVEHAVRLDALDLAVHFDRNEELRTEISAKFTSSGIAAELQAAGFTIDRTWTAAGFALVLAHTET